MHGPLLVLCVVLILHVSNIVFNVFFLTLEMYALMPSASLMHGSPKSWASWSGMSWSLSRAFSKLRHFSSSVTPWLRTYTTNTWKKLDFYCLVTKIDHIYSTVQNFMAFKQTLYYLFWTTCLQSHLDHRKSNIQCIKSTLYPTSQTVFDLQVDLNHLDINCSS